MIDPPDHESEPHAAQLAAGSVFRDRYRVVRLLRQGGMGRVWEVVDTNTDRRRALKVMLPELVDDEDARARFAQEATIAAKVDSLHVVDTFDRGDLPVPFFVMELLIGKNLEDLLRERGRLRPDEVIDLVRQASLALEQIHASGIVHRDLKPANLFVRTLDRRQVLTVVDFGIAKRVGGYATTRAIGTPLYAPPEQLNGDGRIDHRADIHALGHIVYELLVGEPYWHKEAAKSFEALCAAVVLPGRDRASVRAGAKVVLPPGFDAWFERATAREPDDRFPSTSALAEALERLLAEAPVVVTTTRLLPVSLGVGAVLLVAGAVALGVSFMPPSSASGARPSATTGTPAAETSGPAPSATTAPAPPPPASPGRLSSTSSLPPATTPVTKVPSPIRSKQPEKKADLPAATAKAVPSEPPEPGLEAP